MAIMMPKDIQNREDFIQFIRNLSDDVAQSPDNYENLTTSDLLSSAAAWTEDMDGYFSNLGLSTPPVANWDLIAAIFIAALNYE